MMTVSKEHIAKTPGICGGKACIAGHRVRVMDVAIYHDQGMTPAQIVEVFPSVTLADVHAAIAYYLDHPEEIRTSLEEAWKWDEYGKTQRSKVKEALERNPELREKFGVRSRPVLPGPEHPRRDGTGPEGPGD